MCVAFAKLDKYFYKIKSTFEHHSPSQKKIQEQSTMGLGQDQVDHTDQTG